MVSIGDESGKRSHGIGNLTRPVNITAQQRKSASTFPKIETACTIDIGNALTESSMFLIESSLREASKAKYKSYCKQFQDFCVSNSIADITIADIINFLAQLYDKGLSYSVIKSAKAALNQIIFFSTILLNW